MEPTTNTSKMQNSTLTDVTNHRNSDILILSVLIFSFVLILAASHRGAKAAREEELLAGEEMPNVRSGQIGLPGRDP